MRPRKKISQKDIAEALGISHVSVSNALAGRRGVSRELARQIRRTAADLGYGRGGTSGQGFGQDGPDGDGRFLPDGGAADDGFHGVQRMVRRLREKGYEEILYVEPDAGSPGTDGAYGMRLDRRMWYRCAMYLETLEYGREKESEKFPGSGKEPGEIFTPESSRGKRLAKAFDLEGDFVIWTLQEVRECLKKNRELSSAVCREAGTGGNPGNCAAWQTAYPCVDEGTGMCRTAFLCADEDTAGRLADCLEKSGIRVPGDAGVFGYSGKESGGFL